MRTLPLALSALALVAAGCDTGASCTTSDDVSFFLGQWRLVEVSDLSGDRTDEVELFVEDLDVEFFADSSFIATIDYNEAANQAGRPDEMIRGTFTPETGANTCGDRIAAALTFGADPTPFLASNTSSNRWELELYGLIVTELLGDIPVVFGDLDRIQLKFERR